jgi:curved DNA-binding protein CbpA
MQHFNYYEALSVSQNASADEIKKAYRKLALETHPDRNPGDVRAEERFKRINEAYGVLSDPAKRAQYDRHLNIGFQPGRPPGGGFRYSQDEILRDFFTSGHSRDIFQDLEKEFTRMGVRFDSAFINNLFFGGRDVFFQDIVFGSGKVRVLRYGKPNVVRRQAPQPPPNAAWEKLKNGKMIRSGSSLLGKAWKKTGDYLANKVFGPAPELQRKKRPQGQVLQELTYGLQITQRQAEFGGIVQINLSHYENDKLISVRIPPGVKTGTRLRLKDMGNLLPGGSLRRGDLYIILEVV